MSFSNLRELIFIAAMEKQRYIPLDLITAMLCVYTSYKLADDHEKHSPAKRRDGH